MKGRGQVLGVGSWALATLLTMLVAGQDGFARETSAGYPAENLTIVLRVYDYAGAEPAEYARAQQEASRIFRSAGLESVWIDCPVPGTNPQTSPPCQNTTGEPELVLRILPHSMAERLPLDKAALGFAQQSTDGTPAYVASVFYHRVGKLAEELECSHAVILGHTVAHEVGHLLLGANRHSPNGIMCAHWSGKELRRAHNGSLSFLPQQAVRLRNEVHARRLHKIVAARAAE